MHVESLNGMKQLLRQFTSSGAKILDVGSMDIKNKGSYRSIVPPDCTYTGTDISPGPNVDIVMPGYMNVPVPSESYDCVISGQTFEHVLNPFAVIWECARVLKKQGVFIGVAPFEWPEHHKPDRWRFLPGGWEALFQHARLTMVNSYVTKISDGYSDCWGIAYKGV